VVLSWPPLRKRFYEIFLRSHQILAATVAISALLHVPSMLFPRLYFYIALGIFATISAVEGILFLPHNIIFTRSKDKKGPRVEEIFKYSVDDNKNPGDSDKIPVQLAIVPKEPLGMKAGQYINLCIPSLGLRSSLQSHPFVVASWTGKQQTVLELLIEPRNGWTKKLHSRAIDVSGQSGGLGRVWFTGPHGRPVRVEGYEYIFMVATEYGIAPHLPLLERLVQGTLAREVRARRIRLVWVVEDTCESDMERAYLSRSCSKTHRVV
jgi:predicted ferric reductase